MMVLVQGKSHLEMDENYGGSPMTLKPLLYVLYETGGAKEVCACGDQHDQPAGFRCGYPKRAMDGL